MSGIFKGVKKKVYWEDFGSFLVVKENWEKQKRIACGEKSRKN